MSRAVNGSSVDPVHSQLKRAMDRGNRVCVVLLAPSKVVAGAANRPSTESNRRDVQVRISQPAGTHLSLQMRGLCRPQKWAGLTTHRACRADSGLGARRSRNKFYRAETCLT